MKNPIITYLDYEFINSNIHECNIHHYLSYKSKRNSNIKIKNNSKIKIPTSINYIWLTKNDLSNNDYLPQSIINTITDNKRKLDNQDKEWEYFLWTNSDFIKNYTQIEGVNILSIYNLNYIYEYQPLINYYIKYNLYSLMSDIIRQQIIVQNGGIYCDVDYHFTNSPIKLHYIYNSYFGIERNEWSCNIGSGFMALSKQHPILTLTTNLNRLLFGLPVSSKDFSYIKNDWFKFTEKDCIGAALRIAMKHLTISIHIENNHEIYNDLILGNTIIHDKSNTINYKEYIILNNNEVYVRPIGYQDYAQSWQDKCNNEIEYEAIMDMNMYNYYE